MINIKDEDGNEYIEYSLKCSGGYCPNCNRWKDDCDGLDEYGEEEDEE